MTTSTLERLDLEHLLDAEPGCEHEGCSVDATHSARLACGCHALLCKSHAEVAVEVLASILMTRGGVECGYCCAHLTGKSVSDLIRVEAL